MRTDGQVDEIMTWIIRAILVVGLSGLVFAGLSGCAITPKEKCETLACVKWHAAREAGAVARAKCNAWFDVQERSLGPTGKVYFKCGGRGPCCMEVARQERRRVMK